MLAIYEKNKICVYEEKNLYFCSLCPFITQKTVFISQRKILFTLPLYVDCFLHFFLRSIKKAKATFCGMVRWSDRQKIYCLNKVICETNSLKSRNVLHTLLVDFTQTGTFLRNILDFLKPIQNFKFTFNYYHRIVLIQKICSHPPKTYINIHTFIY